MKKLSFYYVIFVFIALNLCFVTAKVVNASSTFNVNSTLDEPDANPGDGICSASPSEVCTLRAAIIEADALPGTDTINLPSGTYALTRTGVYEDLGYTGDLDILDDLIINGSGAASTIIDSTRTDRVIEVHPNVTFSATDFTVEGGNNGNSTYDNNNIYDEGGGILNKGTLTLNLVNVEHNFTHHSSGGGIKNYGNVTLINTNVINNESLGGGGAGIENWGSLNINGGTIADNNGHGSGGSGIDNEQAYSSFILNNVTISGNSSEAIVNYSIGQMNNVTISGNLSGGATVNFGDLTIKNATITNNLGGGVFDFGGGVTHLKNSIVANNFVNDCNTVDSLGFNIIGTNTDCTITGDATGNITGVDPNLDTLKDNGGSTKTHALLFGSVAIDAGTNSDCTISDQRGLPRPVDGDANTISTCDIGAYELQSPYPKSVITSFHAPVDPVLINTQVNAQANFTDQDTGDIHTASWNWGDGNIIIGTLTESNGSGLVSDYHTYTIPGVYTVTLAISDNYGASTTAQYQYITVYDPSAGFLTGSGKYSSLPGWDPQNPQAQGEVKFGISAKYQTGSNVPTGNAKINFKAGNIDFSSTSFQWLGVTGTKATLIGHGTINGSGNYSLLISGIDGGQGGGQNLIRVKIMDNSNNVIYDTQQGAADDADPTTLLNSGNIKVH